MTTELLSFDSPQQVAKFVDDELNKSRAILADYLKLLSETQAKTQSWTRTQGAILKMLGANPPSENAQELSLEGISVVVNPNPAQEVSVIEQLVEIFQRKLAALEKVRKALSPIFALREDGVLVKTYLLAVEGVPAKLLVYINPVGSPIATQGERLVEAAERSLFVPR